MASMVKRAADDAPHDMSKIIDAVSVRSGRPLVSRVHALFLSASGLDVPVRDFNVDDILEAVHALIELDMRESACTIFELVCSPPLLRSLDVRRLPRAARIGFCAARSPASIQDAFSTSVSRELLLSDTISYLRTSESARDIAGCIAGCLGRDLRASELTMRFDSPTLDLFTRKLNWVLEHCDMSTLTWHQMVQFMSNAADLFKISTLKPIATPVSLEALALAHCKEYPYAPSGTDKVAEKLLRALMNTNVARSKPAAVGADAHASFVRQLHNAIHTCSLGLSFV